MKKPDHKMSNLPKRLDKKQ